MATPGPRPARHGRTWWERLAITGTIVTAPTMTAINTFDQPNNVVPTAFTGAQLGGGTLTVTLPPKSVVMLDLR